MSCATGRPPWDLTGEALRIRGQFRSAGHGGGTVMGGPGCDWIAASPRDHESRDNDRETGGQAQRQP